MMPGAITFYVVLDEIQDVYVKMDNASAERGRTIVAQALDLGKNSGSTVTVLTSSSRRMRRYAFKYDVAELGRDAELETANYADLNNSVFKTLSLEPLRTEADLQAALETDNQSLLSSTFYSSGGVYRFFDTAPPEAKWPTDSIRQALLTYMLSQQRILSFPLQGPATVDMAKVQALKNDPWSSMVKVSEAKARAVLQQAASALAAASAARGDQPASVAASLFLLMQDEGYIYCDQGLVTFLRPADAETLARQCCQRMENVNDEMTHACLLVLSSKAGDCGNADVRTERKILEYLVQSGALGEDVAHSPHPLHFSSGQVWQGDDKLTSLPFNTVLRWASEKGVDAFWLEDLRESPLSRLISFPYVVPCTHHMSPCHAVYSPHVPLNINRRRSGRSPGANEDWRRRHDNRLWLEDAAEKDQLAAKHRLCHGRDQVSAAL